MNRFNISFTMLIILLLLAMPLIAEETIMFNFQGRLSDSDGNPVPDGDYQMIYSLYADSLGGTPLWTEVHPAVSASNGFFNVQLGSIAPCSLNIPSLQNVYLATQIGSLPPLARRLRIDSSPHSGVARRLYGDFQSSPGALILQNPESENQTITLNTAVDNTEQAGISIGFAVPPDPWHGTSVELGAGATSAGMELMNIPPEPYHQMSAAINVDSDQAQLNLNDVTSGGGISLNTGATSAHMAVLNVPPDPWHQMSAEINVDSGQAQLSLEDVTSGSGIKLSTALESSQQAGLSIGFAVPPDPFHSSTAQLLTGPATAGMELMSNPPDPWHQMSAGINVDSGQAQLNLNDVTTGSGIGLNTGSEVMGVVIEDRPSDTEAGRRLSAGIESGELNLGFEGPAGQRLFDVSGTPGSLGSITWKMFNPQPEPPGNDPLFVINTNSNGSDLRLFAPQFGGAALANDHPQIKMLSDVSASSLLLQRAFTGAEGDDSIGVVVRADSSVSEMRFFKGNTTQMKITSSATGTSMKFLDDGSEYMGVDGVPWHAGGELTMRDPTGGQTIVLSSTGYIAIGATTQTNILSIRQNSSTDPIADAWTTYSSRRWKTNINTITNPIEKVKALRGVTFNWIEGGRHDIGLIAEEVGQVIPEVVAYEENGIDAKSVDYARLTALLIEAVKEQQKRIEVLEGKLKANGIE